MTPEDKKEVIAFLDKLSEEGLDSVEFMDRATAEKLVLQSLVYLYSSLKGKKEKSIVDDFVKLY